MASTEIAGWKNESGFIWAVLGSVVGFANILSFSSQCYQNGGGAFLIPYFFAYIMMGVPLLLLEGLIGQKNALPFVSSYGKSVGNRGKFFGWVAILSCLTIGAFYTVLTGYSLLYAYFSATGVIPFEAMAFFQESFLHNAESISDFSYFGWNIFFVMVVISGFVWWTLTRGISQGIERICSFVMPLLTVLVIGFAIVASFLPGAMIGIAHFLRPDFSMLSDLTLWRNVFGQLFFSLSLGLGIITGYSQYSGKTVHLKKAMIWVAVGDFFISFVAGWVVFACVGYMSQFYHMPFHEIIKTNSVFEVGFIIFPTILQTFTPKIQPILGIVFFSCVFIAGITGVFSIVENIAGNVEKEFSFSRKKAVTYAILAISGLGIFFCFGNGQLLIGALCPMVLGITMIFSAFTEIIVFLYLTKHIQEDPLWYKKGRRRFSFHILKSFVPILLFAILVGSVFKDMQEINLAFYIRWTWFLLASLLAMAFIKKSETTATVYKAA